MLEYLPPSYIVVAWMWSTDLKEERRRKSRRDSPD
jgi:hypothetical protein